MSTRSHIGILNDNGSVLECYCHFDGYLSHTGKILLNEYTDELKVRRLLIGSMRGVEIEDIPTDTLPRYYAQRKNSPESGADSVAPRLWRDVEDFLAHYREDYTYLFYPATSTWKFREWDEELQPLTEAVIKEDEG